ncbi:putative ATPase, partial [Spiromyces aspiralis]
MESVETTGNLSQAAPAKGAGGSIKGHASGGTSTTTAITTTTKNDDSSSSSSDKKTDKPATSLDDGSASDTNTPSTPVTTAQALDTAADGDGPSLAKDSNIDGETVVDESSRSQTPITNNSEERIGKEVEKGKLRALKEKAMADYEAHAQKQRFQRLNFLLERSSLYASFLTEKMERQRQEQRERDERERQQQQQQQQAELSNEDELNTQGASKKRRLGRPRKGAASKQATGGADEEYDELDGNREDGQRRLKHRRIARDNEKYKLSDYIDPETMTTRDKESKAGQQSQQQQQQQQSKGTVKRSHRQPKTLTGGIMRDYQIEGMEWLVSLYENGLNGILADEMGLGKTIQTISFLTYLRERDVWGPFLIVCPLSTVANWVSEFMRFVPTTPVLLYHGTPQERAYLRQKHLKKLNKSFPVVVTSYELVMNDRKYLQRFAWKYIVVDEGHRIKNLNCKLIRELKSYRSANRLLLTGTPLQNNLAELWSLLNFLLPDIFDDLDSFQSWFDFDDIHQKDGQSRILSEENKSHIISKLHHILQPFLLRRLKADVEHHLPKKREYVISCPMTVEQRQFYKATVDNNLVDFIRKRMLADSLRASGNDGKDSLSVDDVLDGCDDDDDGSDSDH